MLLKWWQNKYVEELYFKSSFDDDETTPFPNLLSNPHSSSVIRLQNDCNWLGVNLSSLYLMIYGNGSTLDNSRS
jgi:hypothetical protein